MTLSDEVVEAHSRWGDGPADSGVDCGQAYSYSASNEVGLLLTQ